MFLRMLSASIRLQKRRKILAFSSLMFGVALCVAVVSLVISVEDHLQRELRSFGANFTVEPEGAELSLSFAGTDVSELKDERFLSEKKVGKIAEIFWKNNVVGFVPVYPVRVNISGSRESVILNGTWLSPQENFKHHKTDIFSLNPGWKVEPILANHKRMGMAVFAGEALAKKLSKEKWFISYSGKKVEVHTAGIIRTGGNEENEIFASLSLVQKITGNGGKVKKVLVSALTTPEHKIYERLGTNPKELSASEFEKWYCTPFPSSIAYQLKEVYPASNVRIVRKFADTEGKVLLRLKSLFLAVMAFTLVISAVSLGNSMVTAIRERRQEIGLMKTLGAASSHIFALFFVEGIIVGVLGGLTGCFMGIALSRLVQNILFHDARELSIALLPMGVGFSLFIAFVGSIFPVLQMARLKPVECLKSL